MKEQRVVKFYGTKARARAAAGAALLDRIAPGWWRKIQLRRLDLSSTCNCVTGQLFGDYVKGLAKLDLDHDDAEHYGFHQHDHDVNAGGTWWALTRAWKDEVRARRYAHKIGRQR